jgi:hypothetical protein
MTKAAGHFGESYDPPSTGLSKVSGITMDDYHLPVTDVQTARRNFPGYTVEESTTMQDLVTGETEGTTDTDYATHKHYGEESGYTKINKKSGKPRSKGGKALSINALGSGRI